MKRRIKVAQYGRDAVLEAKQEVEYDQMEAMFHDSAKQAERFIDEGWEHVLYGMKKYGLNGNVTSADLMIVPMHDDQFAFLAKRCRSAVIYALHRRDR